MLQNSLFSQSRTLSRRAILTLGASSALVISAALPRSTWATDKCDIISQLIANAKGDAENAGPWAMTLDPLAVIRLQDAVKSLREAIDEQSGVVDEARRQQLLQYADAVGSLALLIAGVFVGLGPVFIGSIALSGTLLVANTISSPTPMIGPDITLNIAASRIPVILEAFGEGAGAVSKNAASYGKLAGNVAGIAFTAYSFYEFGRKTTAFQTSTVVLQKLRENLDALESDMAKLSDLQTLQSVRQSCAMAVLDDMKVIETASCPMGPG